MRDTANQRQHSNPKTGSAAADQSNTVKDPRNWVTGDKPMIGAQASYLKTLCEEMGEAFDSNLTKAGASKRIDELRSRDPRLNAK